MAETTADEQNTEYQVLARKYRPRTFEDIIGQDAMVKTLRNAFSTGRVAHAFMLTGVRGIGKTTTARLLARALNYTRDGVDGPSVDLSTPGEHCEAIMASRHMDVLEMDAASRTGVENMRELLDGVRYSPVSARFKVYVIDEVHMLSTGAFNALLKTLEEPPDHAKFIFATTEIRKVPITVLSRCQRFDLRRVEAGELATHLSGIAEKEGAKVSEDGIALLARAAEGSVRDGLSLLDQAIVQRVSGETEVTAEQIREMLGLADRARIFDLFEHIAKADTKAALLELRGQYDHGADPVVVIRDLLDSSHEVSRVKALGDGAALDVAPDQLARIQTLTETLSMGQLTRLWQMLLKAYEDVRLAPDPLAAAEMALIKLCVAADLPPPEWAAQLIAQLGDDDIQIAGVSNSAAPAGSSGGAQAMLKPKPAPQPQTVNLTSLEAIADHAEQIGKRAFAHDIRRCMKLVSFSVGKIEFEPVELAPTQLVPQLKDCLKDWTGQDWNIIVSKAAPAIETIREREQREQREQDERDAAHPAIIEMEKVFPGAELVEIRDIRPKSADVIEGNFPIKKKD